MKIDTGKNLDRAALRERRKERGLSQLELATLTGRTEVALWKIEAGRLQPSYEWVTAIAKVLNVDVEDLLTDAEQVAS